MPLAKLQNGKSYSIITDHLGTPFEAYNEEGAKVWTRQLDIYGKTKKETGEVNFIPYLYQGQYLDVDTGLAYNRFRYYSVESGGYISQDPIGLAGGMANMYAYVGDLNSWVDVFGLAGMPWAFHGAAEDDIISKGTHFYAGDGRTELKLRLDENGKVDFEPAFDQKANKKGNRKNLQKALREAREKLLTDNVWRKKMLTNLSKVKNNMFNQFRRLDRAREMKKIEKALKLLDKTCG